MYIYYFSLWFITRYWLALPVPCSRTSVSVHPVDESLPLLIPNSQSFPPSSTSPLATTHLFSTSVSLSLFHRYLHFYSISDSTCKWYHMVFFCFWLTTLSMQHSCFVGRSVRPCEFGVRETQISAPNPSLIHCVCFTSLSLYLTISKMGIIVHTWQDFCEHWRAHWYRAQHLVGAQEIATLFIDSCNSHVLSTSWGMTVTKIPVLVELLF